MPNAKPASLSMPGTQVRALSSEPASDGRFARWACVFLCCVYVGRLQELWDPLSALHLGYVALTMGMLACLTSPPNLGRYLKTPQARRILGIFLCCLVSVPFSVWPGRSLKFSFLEFGLVLVFLGMLLRCLRTTSSVVLLMRAYLACAVVLAVCSLRAGGERVAASATYDPNDIALVLVCGLPFLWQTFGATRSGVVRLGLLAAAVLMLAGIAHTGSRGGLLGLGSVSLFLLLFDSTVSVGKRMAIVVLASLAVAVLAPALLWERLENTGTEEDYNMNARGGRIEIWKRGLQMMVDNPLTGVGAGAFAVADGQYQGEESGRWSVAHNSFIEVGSTIGVIGLYFFVRLLLGAIAAMMGLARARNGPPDPRAPAALALAASLTGYCVSGFFLAQGFSSLVYVLVGLTMILAMASPPEEAAASGPAAVAEPTARRRRERVQSPRGRR
jgi:O-antigen ligase